jgi:DMSO reductase anchor subunit
VPNLIVEILAVLWVAGLVLYFRFTSERGREDNLLVLWILLSLPVAGYPITRWLFP